MVRFRGFLCKHPFKRLTVLGSICTLATRKVGSIGKQSREPNNSCLWRRALTCRSYSFLCSKYTRTGYTQVHMQQIVLYKYVDSRIHQIGLDGFPTHPHKTMLLGVSQHFRKVQKLHWTIVAGSIYGILPSPQSPAVASTNLPRAHRFPNRWFHARQWAGSPARYCRRKDIGHKG